MQAVVMSGYGTPDVLNVSEVDLPDPGANLPGLHLNPDHYLG